MLQAIVTFSKNEEQKMETFLNTCIWLLALLTSKRMLLVFNLIGWLLKSVHMALTTCKDYTGIDIV